jgi:glycosyltransferase involved in cell wall biosynthesis
MARRIRIFQLITTTIGGAGEHMLQLSRGLDRSRFDVTVAFAPGMPLDQAFHDAGLRVVPVPMDRKAGLWSSFRAFVSLVRLMRRERYDIVETHTSVAGLLGRVAAKLAGVPVVVHMVHAYAGHDFVSPGKRWLFTQMERVMDYITDFYIAGSDAILGKGIARGVFPARKARRIYYSIDLESYDRAASGSSVRMELGIPDDVLVVGLVGRLEPQKGIEFFIEAVAQLAVKWPRVEWLVAGDGPHRDEYLALAEARGVRDRIRFLGWRKDVAAVMSALDILAIPSRWEAFGIVNLEAMRVGIPVVGFATEGIPEVVKHGETGLLVTPMDVPAFIVALDELLGDAPRRRSLGAAGRIRVERLFTTQQMVRQHEELFDELLVKVRA